MKDSEEWDENLQKAVRINNIVTNILEIDDYFKTEYYEYDVVQVNKKFSFCRAKW